MDRADREAGGEFWTDVQECLWFEILGITKSSGRNRDWQ